MNRFLCVVLGVAACLPAGCGLGQIRTLEDWRITETRVETIGRMSGLLAADAVRAKHGLSSEEGMRLARVGRALNLAAEQLAGDEVPDAALGDVVEEFLDGVLDLSFERSLAVSEGLALAKELAAGMETSARARLWLAVFCRSASRAILEVYEDEFVDGTDHGDRALDPVGDS